MNHRVTLIESLSAAHKDLAPVVRDDSLIFTGDPLPQLGGMRPREALANWLLCAALSKASAMFTGNPTDSDGDGVIIDTDTLWEHALTEHVLAAGSDGANIEALILEKVEGKNARGKSYAFGKTLIVYLATTVEWCADVVARQLPDPLFFVDVYVVSRMGIDDGEHVYRVALLDLAEGDAPVWRVRIQEDFADWTVQQQ